MEPTDMHQSQSITQELETDMELPVDVFDEMSEVEKELYHHIEVERANSEIVQDNYKTLKAEYLRLEEAYDRVEEELKDLKNDKEAHDENMEKVLSELQQQLLDKTKKLVELQSQVMTPHHIMLIKAEVQQDMEAAIQQWFQKLKEEAENYRTMYNKLARDYADLSAEHDCQMEEHRLESELMKRHHEAQISILVKEKEDLVARDQASDSHEYKKQVEVLQSEKADLELRLKVLQDDIVDAHKEMEKTKEELENTQCRSNNQQYEFEAKNKSLEVENQAVRHQLELLEQKYEATKQQNDQLKAQIHRAEQDVSALNDEIKTLKQTNKEEVTTVKLQSACSQEKLEREKEELQRQIDGLLIELETTQETVDWHKKLLEEVQSIRDECTDQCDTLQEDKLKLQHQLDKLTDQKAEQMAAHSEEIELQKKQLCDAKQSWELANEEMESLRHKVQQQDLQLQELRMAQDQAQRKAEDLSTKLLEEKQEWQARHEKLKEKYSKMKKKTGATEHQLKNNLELMEAKNQELELKLTQAKRHESNHEEKRKLRKQLKELQQKFELQQLQLSSQGTINIGQLQLNCSQTAVVTNTSEEPDKHQKEIFLLKQRMDKLREAQQQQLDSLSLFPRRTGQKTSKL